MLAATTTRTIRSRWAAEVHAWLAPSSGKHSAAAPPHACAMHGQWQKSQLSV